MSLFDTKHAQGPRWWDNSGLGGLGFLPCLPRFLEQWFCLRSTGKKVKKPTLKIATSKGQLLEKNMFHEHSLTLTMCCNNTSIAPFFTCHMSLNPPPLKQDAGTNLFQTHSPGLGFSNFRCAGRKFKFHLQKKKHQELEDC